MNEASRDTSPFEAILQFLEGNGSEIPNPYDSEGSGYIPAYVSPADFSFARPLNGPGSTPGSYFNIAGDHSYPANWQALRTGATLTASFPDGTATTIAFAERYSRCFETSTCWWLTSDGCRSSNSPNSPLGTCTNPAMRRPTFADPDYDDVQPVTINGVTKPSIPGRTFQVSPTINSCDYRVPQTPHISGMLTAYFDGSIKITRPTITPEVRVHALNPLYSSSKLDLDK